MGPESDRNKKSPNAPSPNKLTTKEGSSKTGDEGAAE